MTKEQIKQQFPDATEEQITAILDINGTDLTAVKKNNVDQKELKRLQDIEGKYKELEEADLTDAEKVAKTLKEAENAKLEFTKKSNKLEVEKILVTAGLQEEDYKGFIDGIVSDNAETSILLANNLVSMLKKQQETIEQKTKENLLDDTKTPEGSNGSDKNDNETVAEKTAKNIAETQKSSNQTTKSVLDCYM